MPDSGVGDGGVVAANCFSSKPEPIPTAVTEQAIKTQDHREGNRDDSKGECFRVFFNGLIGESLLSN